MSSQNKKPPLSVLQIGMNWFPEGTFGGLGRVYFNLINSLSANGVIVQGLVAGTPSVSESSNGRVVSFASSTAFLPARLWAVRNAIRDMRARSRIDLVASHFALYTYPALGLIDDLPLVVHFHGPWSAESRTEGASRLVTAAKKRIELKVYAQAARAIVLSQAFGNILHNEYDYPRELIRVVPGGVDTNQFNITIPRSQARDSLGLAKDRPIVLSPRRLVKRMGLENLIKAATIVRERIPEVLFVIVGTGPLAGQLKSLVEQDSLDRHISLVGYVADDLLPFYYRAANLTVVPTTTFEGFGLITLESLASGTPVLVTPVGGLPEAVMGLSDKMILPDLSIDTLAEGIISVLKKRTLLPSEDECRKYVVTNFSWRSISERVRAVYNEVV
jgi:glycosyltransferase involved in cell wall biosynthesis